MYKKASLIITTVIVVVAVGGFGWWMLFGAPEGRYYVQVDNAKTQELESKGGVIDPTGGMALQYTLPAYDENGVQREMTFGAERELRDDAYLRLTVMPVRGVTEWAEVQYDDIPAKAQERLAQEQHGE